MRRFAPLLLLPLLVAGLNGCKRGGGAGDDSGPFPGAPIVVISIDTLRSDHLPAYGYDGVETPAIDALRRDAILYERAYSHTPLTLPSHVSLLTGQLPTRHGVRDNIGYDFDANAHPYLPKILREAGYATGGAVSAYVLRGETGLGTAFDFYEDGVSWRPTEVMGNSQRSGRETARLALDWLRTLESKSESKPFFLFLHLYEPHTPYAPPEPFAARYRASPYDGEIAEADAVVGQILDELKERGLYDKSIIVLLSDHGEGLGDHGEAEHGIFLYREALQVPLLVKLPDARRGGTSVAAPAQLVDLPPTLLRLIGREVPTGQMAMDGGSLLDIETGGKQGASERVIYAETFYPRLHFGWSELTSVIRGPMQYIDAPRPELYDLVADPRQTRNVLEQERRTYAALRGAVEKLEAPLAAPSQVDAETASRLASLGYLAGGASATDGPLADPKDRIHTLRDFGEAMSLFAQQRFAEAVPRLERLVAENPNMADAWENLAQSLQKVGRQDDALAAFKKAMETSGGAAHIAIATGGLLLEMKRYDEARQHAELALPTSPAGARGLLSQIAMAQGDLAAAESQARQAVEAEGSKDRIMPRIVLAQTLQKQGKLEDALRETQGAVDDVGRLPGNPKFSGLFFLHGDLLARLGREAEAERAFLREIQDFPSNPYPYTRLSVLYASQNRPAEAVGILRTMVDRNNTPLAYAEAVRTLRTLGDVQGAARLLQYARQQHPGSKELREM
ncbi:MAG TPA: sulfatase-like hydrolase/transferase [Thermoanaerobaculia bacterium]|nr:sulfatase-like hydrolase/transferase [Thermoanaerobaculia bacterium]